MPRKWLIGYLCIVIFGICDAAETYIAHLRGFHEWFLGFAVNFLVLHVGIVGYVVIRISAGIAISIFTEYMRKELQGHRGKKILAIAVIATIVLAVLTQVNNIATLIP